MNSQQESFLQRCKWHIVAITGVVVPIVYYRVFLNASTPKDTGGEPMSTYILTCGAVLSLMALLLLLWRISNIVDTLKDNSVKMEEVAKALTGITDGLAEIERSTRLSENAKAIAFRDTERESLHEAVSQKISQQDFEAAYELIDEIQQRHEYGDLAQQLRIEADQYYNAGRNERIEGVIEQIKALLDQYQWSRASVQIEGLIKAYPDSERARVMRQQLHVRKETHKKELLSAWDGAVQHQDTDRSLEVLKELDMYLTANEALALQEAAKDVFRNKLHNLGVQFSLAVSDKKWTSALEVGEKIIADFPNSKMSGEIRDKLDVLRQNVQLNT
jgi:hypothetical protein